ncbi:MAG: hypothetical protein KDB62_07570 [Solirubrobacterales bacterium]|nr:hypothetical protein [Solirubrobacterales bacterium]
MANGGPATDQIEADRDLLACTVLATCFAVAIFTVAMPIVLMNTEYTVLQAPLAPHKQGAETALYLFAILVVTPVSYLLARWVAGRIRSGSNGECLTGLASALAVPLGFGLLLVRHSASLPWGDGIKATLALGLVWSVIAAATLFAAMRSHDWTPARFFVSARVPLGAAAAAAAAAAILSVVELGHLDLPFLIAALAASGLIIWAYARNRPRPVPGRWGIGIDILIILLIALAVPDMLIYEPGSGDFAVAFRNYVTQFHQSLFVGAASQILDGSALLVDTVSQYGIGSVYLVAAFFEIAPIGYLTLGFFEGILSAIMFAIAYGILRIAGIARTLAAAAMAVAVITLAWGLEYPIGALLQHGAIRFGLPVLLIAPVVAGARWPQSWPAMRLVALAVVGVSSIWALEGFIYVSATAAGLIAIGATWVPAASRLRWLVMACASVVAAWVAAQVLFALITLAATGSLPDWGLYLTYLREFLAGDIGDLTYDISPWSPSLAVFGSYVVSAILIAFLTGSRRDFTGARRPAFLALTGLTAYGMALFSYFDNRSLDHVLTYVCLPALMILTIWLGLALDRSVGLSGRTRIAALSSGLALAALTLASVWPAAGDRGQNSLLAYSLPGGESVRDGLHRIWNPPPIRRSAASGQRLIERFFPNTGAVPVVTEPDLDNEILARAGRANQLRITDAKEASWVPGPHRPEIREAAESLEAGDRMLVDADAIAAVRRLSRDPEAALAEPEPIAEETGLQTIQVEALAWISRNYRLKPVESSPDGLTVVELEPY